MPRYLYEIHCTCFCPVISWHGLLPVAPYLTKGNHDVVVMIRALHLDNLEVPDQDVLMNILARLHFSNMLIPSSTSVWNQWSPLIVIHWDSFMNTLQSVLYRCNSRRRLGGFEAVQIWSYKTKFKMYSKYQILNLFEMSNILNLFEMSSSTSV